MNIVEIIKKKRNGGKLTNGEISFLIHGYLNGDVADYQITSFLMAVYFRGMDDEETINLTEIMLNSGDIIDLSGINGIKIDKHSTGGVGDKTSLILAPQLASLGVFVPMISGRGLGHTGGTLDKLESIPGFRINMDVEEYKKTLEKVGCVMIGQTNKIAPADKKIYALRDVTATVDSLPLIISSILSKKHAEGAEALVFDVKIGTGANLQDEKESEKLAKQLVSVSKKFGTKAIAVLTDMNQPLGNKIGNWLETEECIEVMRGKKVDDLLKVNNVLAGAMLLLAGKAKDIDEGEIIAGQAIDNGTTYNKFLEMVEVQSGDVNYVNDYNNLKRPAHSHKFVSEKEGYITGLDAFNMGVASVELGAGRKTAEDKIDYLSGIILNKKCGDKVSHGEVICELFAENENKIINAKEYVKRAVEIGDKKISPRKLIIDIID